ncbi:hypothetical protein EBU58_06610, partial [bacterium]|nr:hypothetical protein [bacterium]
MTTPSGIRVVDARVFFLPVVTRMPLKFGGQTVTSVTCARVAITVEDAGGRQATGWGETPLSVQWAWPADLPYDTRHEAMQSLVLELGRRWVGFGERGHPLVLGSRFLEDVLPGVRRSHNSEHPDAAIPTLASLICASPFDIAIHDAYGVLHGVDTYQTYGRDHLDCDLAALLEPAPGSGVRFQGRVPADMLVTNPAAVPTRLPAWHLVGGLDPLTDADRKVYEKELRRLGVYDDFVAKIGPLAPRKPTFQPKPLDDFTRALMGNKQARFRTILEKTANGTGCEQLRYIILNQDKAEEPMWRAGLSIAQHCVDRDKAIHVISKKHPDYTPAATEKKAAQIKGPYTCNTFNGLNAGVCPECPNWGKIKSPILIGRQIQEAPVEEEFEFEVTEGYTAGPEIVANTIPSPVPVIPKYPNPYFRGRNG